MFILRYWLEQISMWIFPIVFEDNYYAFRSVLKDGLGPIANVEIQ
jgi:hypothetical protein